MGHIFGVQTIVGVGNLIVNSIAHGFGGGIGTCSGGFFVQSPNTIVQDNFADQLCDETYIANGPDATDSNFAEPDDSGNFPSIGMQITGGISNRMTGAVLKSNTVVGATTPGIVVTPVAFNTVISKNTVRDCLTSIWLQSGSHAIHLEANVLRNNHTPILAIGATHVSYDSDDAATLTS